MLLASISLALPVLLFLDLITENVLLDKAVSSVVILIIATLQFLLLIVLKDV